MIINYSRSKKVRFMMKGFGDEMTLEEIIKYFKISTNNLTGIKNSLENLFGGSEI